MKLVPYVSVRKSFARFRSRNIDLEEREHSGMSAVIIEDQIETPIKIHPGHTTLDIAEILHVSHMM